MTTQTEPTTTTRKRSRGKPDTPAPILPSTFGSLQGEPVPPVHDRRGLSFAQAAHYGQATHKANTEEQVLREGKMCPLSWKMMAVVFEQLWQASKSGEESGTLRAALADMMEPFPYDTTEWAASHRFVCRTEARDVNGQPPAFGLVVLDHSPHRMPDREPTS